MSSTVQGPMALRVLVACEFSGVVREAFAARGHDAWSCDLLPSERPGNHIQGDVMDVLGAGWDLMVAHPPCTFLTYAGMSKWNAPGRKEEREAALRFFLALYQCPIQSVAVENPRGFPCKEFRRPDQQVNPFDFGEFERKRVCLWLKNLPPLMLGPLAVVKPRVTYIKSNGRQYNGYFHQGKSGKARSRFFPSIAAAMAEQWGEFCRERSSNAPSVPSGLNSSNASSVSSPKSSSSGAPSQ